jgi:triphosphatase
VNSARADDKRASRRHRERGGGLHWQAEILFHSGRVAAWTAARCSTPNIRLKSFGICANAVDVPANRQTIPTHLAPSRNGGRNRQLFNRYQSSVFPMSPARELELKLEVPPDSLYRLARSSLLQATRKKPSKPATLVSVYFDTDKLKLRNMGLSLRVRRVGRRHVQTIKQETGDCGALFTRNEWEHDIGGKLPDLDAAQGTALGPLLNKKLRRGLKPVFETHVRRTIYPISQDGSEIELTIDRGKVQAGGQSSPLCEVELELKRGESAELFRLAHGLAEQVPVQLAVKSKAERGYALVTAEKPQPIKAAPVALAPDSSRQAAFQAIARACLHQLVGNLPAVQGGDPEGLHQMRVALRRLRAAISLFADMLVDPRIQQMKAEFKWVTGELGPARELDVFIKQVVKPVADSKPNAAGVAVLTRDLQQRREDAVARAAEAIESARFRALVLDSAAWIETGDWTRDDLAHTLREQPITVAAAKELRKRWRKILKRGARLDTLDSQRRHKFRIQTKKLRYASEFFGGAFPGKKATRRRKGFVAGLEKLQDALGDLNDIAVHEGLSERIVDAQGAGGKQREGRAKKAFAAGRLSGREEARIASVLKDADRAYRAFAKAKPFWS